MRRTVLPVVVLALAGCSVSTPTSAATVKASSAAPSASTSVAASSSPPPSEQLPPATVERLFGEELQKQGFVPRFGTVQGSIELARAICFRFDTGDSYATVSAILTKDGMTSAEAGAFTSMATVAFCPADASKING